MFSVKHIVLLFSCMIMVGNLGAMEYLMKLGTIIYFLKQSFENSPEQRRLDRDLFNAIGYQNLEKIEELLRQGARIDVEDQLGRLPVDVATENGYLPGAMLLTERMIVLGLGKEERMWKTLAHNACVWERSNISSFIFREKKDQISMQSAIDLLFDGFVMRDYNAFKLLMEEKKIDINVRKNGDRGDSLLHAAMPRDDGGISASSFLGVVKFLVNEKNVDVNIRNLFEETPLHLICRCEKYFGAITIVEYLVQHGANVNCSDNQGKTPLHYAIRSKSKPLIEFLILGGAKTDFLDNEGETPLDYANAETRESIERFIENAKRAQNMNLQALKRNDSVDVRFGFGTDIFPEWPNAETESREDPLRKRSQKLSMDAHKMYRGERIKREHWKGEI